MYKALCLIKAGSISAHRNREHLSPYRLILWTKYAWYLQCLLREMHMSGSVKQRSLMELLTVGVIVEEVTFELRSKGQQGDK